MSLLSLGVAAFMTFQHWLGCWRLFMCVWAYARMSLCIYVIYMWCHGIYVCVVFVYERGLFSMTSQREVRMCVCIENWLWCWRLFMCERVRRLCVCVDVCMERQRPLLRGGYSGEWSSYAKEIAGWSTGSVTLLGVCSGWYSGNPDGPRQGMDGIFWVEGRVGTRWLLGIRIWDSAWLHYVERGARFRQHFM